MPTLSDPGFDVVGDVHGCERELVALLDRLGYRPPVRRKSAAWQPPKGRHLVFVGDLVDRGPSILGVLDIVMAMAEAGDASSAVGNHDDKLLRWLRGRAVKVTQGLETSIRAIETAPGKVRRRVDAFLAGLPSHLVLDEGGLVVAHAGLAERYHGDFSARVRALAMFGPTEPGEDPWGFPIRNDWAAEYRGRAAVVYGHTPVVEAVWRNDTIDIDTGVVFGHRLTAVRYPEREIVWVPAERVYQQKGGPFRQFGPGGPPVSVDVEAAS